MRFVRFKMILIQISSENFQMTIELKNEYD